MSEEKPFNVNWEFEAEKILRTEQEYAKLLWDIREIEKWFERDRTYQKICGQSGSP